MTSRPAPAVSRRGLLSGLLAGGAAAAAAPLLTAAPAVAADAPAPTTPTSGSPAYRFFADESLNFQALFGLGGIGYGAGELGEWLTTFDRIHARGDSYAAYCEEFVVSGRRLRERGDAARARGNRVSARAAYLRAATYFDQALYFVLATSRPTRAHEAAVYRESAYAWSRVAELSRPRWKPIAVPYGRTTLPAWLLVADGAGRRSRRPTVILNNGSDGQNGDVFVEGGAAALERGWNALIFQGPGQGANLFLKSMPFRPDWQHVVTPVLDTLREQPEVDPRRIVLAGTSFGGLLVLQAAAHERRLAAVVADPGVHDAFVSWNSELPRAMLELLAAGRKAEFDGYWAEALRELPATMRFNVAKRAEIYGSGSFYDQMRLAQRFRIDAATVARVKAPTAILSPEGEQFFPGQPATVYSWLRAPSKTLLRFTAAEGAQFHCEPMAPQLRNERVYDWLERNLKPVGR